jgi:uncharacterized OsmC-like protein
MPHPESLVAQRQNPLMKRYRVDPGAAKIRDGAHARVGAATDPFHVEVVPENAGGRAWAIGIHHAVGGDHDLPNPGDVLAAALATCLHTTTRILADRVRIPVLDLDVTVAAEVDVRGCLMVDPSVPVGFQRMRVTARLRVPDDVDDDRLRPLTQMAERCCVVMQTLKGGTDVQTEWQVERAPAG